MSRVAAQSIPVVGVPVTITDSAGKTTLSDVTDATGRYTVVVTGKAPFVLTVPVTDTDGTPAVLSSMTGPAGSSGTAIANLNPLTSLVTQRVLGAARIGAATITAANLQQAVPDVNGVRQPLFASFGVPADEVSDPVGYAPYTADSSSPLDALFEIPHFTVHTNTGSNTHQAVQRPLSGARPGFAT